MGAPCELRAPTAQRTGAPTPLAISVRTARWRSPFIVAVRPVRSRGSATQTPRFHASLAAAQGLFMHGRRRNRRPAAGRAVRASVQAAGASRRWPRRQRAAVFRAPAHPRRYFAAYPRKTISATSPLRLATLALQPAMLSAIARTCNNIAPFAAKARTIDIAAANLRVCAPIMSCAPSRQFCTWQRAMPPSCGAMFGPQRDATSVPRARTAPRAVCARCGPYRGRRIERPCSAACQYSFDTAFSTCNSFLNVQPYSTRCRSLRRSRRS